MKNAYRKNKSVPAAMGVKIAAKGLDKAVRWFCLVPQPYPPHSPCRL